MFKYIDKIGIELEGGWNTRPENIEIAGDGSVSISSEYVGEIISNPLPSIDKIEKFIDKYYPNNVNSSCGFHIHISLKSNLYYSRLMESEFFEYFKGQFNQWAVNNNIKETGVNKIFWERFNGHNSFCENYFRPDRQSYLHSKESTRYSQLNYCYSLHHTLECRLLPMFKKKELSKSGLRKFVEIVETYLAKIKIEKSIGEKITIQDNVKSIVEVICA